MNRPRVLFITAAYPTREAPVHCVFIREHAHAAAQHADVVVLHGPVWVDAVDGLRGWRLREEQSPEICDGLRTFVLEVGRSPIPRTHTALQLAATAAAVLRLRREGFRPDVVHGNLFRSGIPGAVAARLCGAPLVLSEHLSDFPRRLLDRRAEREAGIAFRAADLVMPVSRALADAIAAYGFRPAIEIVPNAVDTSVFHPGPRPLRERARLLFVGAMLPVKGVDGLLTALARLRERDDWELELVGDGPRRADYEALAASLGLGERVRFVGRVLKAGVAAHMRAADVFVLPSTWENLPCVLIEAQATGLPAVATDVGGVGEVASASDTILCRPRDAGALAAALEAMLSTHGTYDRHAISQHAAHRYSRQAVGEQLRRIYARVGK